MAAPLGNQYAAKAKRWTAAIDRALERRANKLSLRDAQEALDLLAEQFLEALEKGDIAGYRELADRLDGKAPQGVVLSGDPDAPVKIETIERRIVNGQNT